MSTKSIFPFPASRRLKKLTSFIHNGQSPSYNMRISQLEGWPAQDKAEAGRPPISSGTMGLAEYESSLVGVRGCVMQDYAGIDS